MITEEPSVPRRWKDYVGLTARGLAMGASDVVPGVSGGTMAFILGIYEELVTSIKDLLSPRVVRLLLRFRFKEALQLIRWKFLTAVLVGILLAIFLLAPGLEWMLVHQPVLLWSFFFGLVAASIFTVVKRVSRWEARTVGGAAAGALAAYSIVGLVPAETPDTLRFFFLSGFIAICAMILPGISGSFILVLLGKYQDVLSAVNTRNFLTLSIFGLGCVVGIVSFAQLLSWLFRRYHDGTVAVLIGLMGGSLRKIWPWKETTRIITDGHGNPIPVEQINILPSVWNAMVTLALLLAVAGFAVVFVLDFFAARKRQDG